MRCPYKSHSHVFPPRRRTRITDRYCCFFMVAKIHKLVHFHQLSKQNYSTESVWNFNRGIVCMVVITDGNADFESVAPSVIKRMYTVLVHVTLVWVFCRGCICGISPSRQRIRTVSLAALSEIICNKTFSTNLHSFDVCKERFRSLCKIFILNYPQKFRITDDVFEMFLREIFKRLP